MFPGFLGKFRGCIVDVLDIFCAAVTYPSIPYCSHVPRTIWFYSLHREHIQIHDCAN